MNFIVLESPPFISALLTDESASSRYGIPILRCALREGSRDLGPADRLAPAVPAAAVVASWGSHHNRTAEERRAAVLFCAQWPVGPQVREFPA